MVCRLQIQTTDLLLSIGKKLSNVLLGGADILVQDLRTVNNLWLSRIEHFTNLPCNQSFSGSRRAVKNDA